MNAFKCLRIIARPSTTSPLLRTQLQRSFTPVQARSLSILTPRRPMLPISSSSTLPTGTLASAYPAPASETLDLAGKMSAHPSMGSMQIRCGPRDTYNPSHLVRKRRHGFLSRIRTKKGRKLLMRRLKKGRWNLSH